MSEVVCPKTELQSWVMAGAGHFPEMEVEGVRPEMKSQGLDGATSLVEGSSLKVT